MSGDGGEISAQSIASVQSGGVTPGSAFTVATLPSASANPYARAAVTDANATLTAGIGTTVAAGGSNKVPVWSDGTNWKIG